MKHALLVIGLIMALASFSHSAHAAANLENGKKLHEEKCKGCHAGRFGNNGDDIYTRFDHRVDSMKKLSSQVAFCSQQTGAQWFDEEVADVTAYLNETFYKFGK
ncbi:MAG: hypothetical protein G8345_05535 [Magnetococcales bacterium]|nr:hypothetical protein [Magnetococcales bacterium]NGZ26331.1 hypothetical protein [Magnetococcales bacterium]